MPEASSPREFAARARLAANWLALGAAIDVTSLAFTVVAIAAMLWLDASSPVRLALLAAALSGLAEKYFACRVAFDRSIFRDWARRWETAGAVAPETDLADFDAALATAGLRCPDRAGARTMDERMRGAMKLLTRQAGLFAVQSLALLAAAVSRHGA